MVCRQVAESLGRVSRHAGLALALAVGGLFAVPAIASAATVSSAGSTITYQANPGETNSVVVNDPSATTYTFAETPITAGTGCVQTNANLVTCTNASTNVSIVMSMGDMGDTANAGNANQAGDSFQINGEAGTDALTGSDQVDTINGGTEADTVNGQNGNDTINGDAGNDDLDGQNGLDTIDGGADADTIEGGGDAGVDTLSGGTGTDTIAGGDGNDVLNGGDDNDALIGDNGADDLNGDNGNDRLDGGNNGNFDDDFDGGTGIDRLVSGIIAGNTYTCAAQADVITMDNVANDLICSDAGSDNNNVRDSVESVTGSNLGDTITGSCLANTFAGSNNAAANTAPVDGGDSFNGDPEGCATNGTDFLGGGEGNDVFNCDGSTGTAGFDTVTYGTPYTGGAAISITLDDVANDNDGMGNLTDNVQGDCERIIGTGGNDTIDATGADQGVQLFGRLGDDTLTDSTFDDLLNGEGGTADVANCTNGGTDTAVGIETNNGCEL